MRYDSSGLPPTRPLHLQVKEEAQAQGFTGGKLEDLRAKPIHPLTCENRVGIDGINHHL